MITNDEQLSKAKEAVRNLELILESASKIHSSLEFRKMSEPVLLEIQKRKQEITQYLTLTASNVSKPVVHNESMIDSLYFATKSKETVSL